MLEELTALRKFAERAEKNMKDPVALNVKFDGYRQLRECRLRLNRLWLKSLPEDPEDAREIREERDRVHQRIREFDW